MEQSLRNTIAFVDGATAWACPARVAGINGDDLNPCELGLVFQKATKLKEAPRVLHSSLGLANRDPTSDALEIFDGNSTVGVFGFGDETLGDLVIDITGKAGFLSSAFAQKPLGRFRTLRLQSGSKLGMPSPQSVNLSTGVDFAVRIGGDVDDSQIDTQKTFGLFDLRLGHDAVVQQVELSVNHDQIRLAPNSNQLLLAVLATDERHDLSALQSEDGHAVHALKRQKSVIQNDSSVGLESVMLGPIPSQALNHLSDSADGHLCRKMEAIPDDPVAGVVQTDMGSRFKFMGYSRDVVGGLIERLHRIQEHLLLVFGRQQFDLDCQVHIGSITYSRQMSITQFAKVFG